MPRNILVGLGPVAVAPIVFFAPAGTLDFRQAWAYLAFSAVATVALASYLRWKDPELLERRMRTPVAEKDAGQAFLHVLAILVFAAAVVVSSLDRRFAWSEVPLYVEIAGFVLVALGYLIYFAVFRENTYAGATIDVVSGQEVISTGPYAIVRHPMYVGLLALLLGTPLALGSWWGLVTFAPMLLILNARIRFEERFLTRSLPGYTEFCRRIRYRVVPFVW